jgi:hypothetical protein
VCIVELREPTGWIAIPLSSPASSSSSSSSSQQQQPGSSAPSAAAEEQPLRAFFFQVQCVGASLAGAWHALPVTAASCCL